MSDLILLRHGETAGQSSIRFYGSTDIALSELGEKQMSRSAEALRALSFKTVITSPLRRSRDGASIVLDGRSPEPVVVEDFREINFGEWEGLTTVEIEERYPDLYRKWKEHGSLSGFPGGDLRAEFFERIVTAAKDVFNRIEMPALAVLHKGVIRGILSALLDIPVSDMTDKHIELGSIHRLGKISCGWSLLSENETGHLGEYRISNS